MAFVTDVFTSNGGVTGLTAGGITASGSDRYLFIAVYAEGGVTVSSIAYGGQTPTAISGATVNPYGDVWQIYGLAAPATGSQIPSVTFSGSSSRCMLYAQLWDDVGSLSTPAVEYVESTSTALIATTSASQTVVDFCVVVEGSMTVDGAQTSRELQNDWSGVFRSFGSSSKTAVGSSTTMTWTPVASCDCFHIAIPFTAAGGGGGPGPNLPLSRKFGPQSFLRTLITQ